MYSKNPFTESPIPRFVLLAALLFPWIVVSPALSQSAPDSSESDRATLIVLAPLGPVFIDLHLTVSRVAYRAWVARFLATEMDVDQSGRLDEAELNLLTNSSMPLAEVTISTDILKAMNVATADVAVDDFNAWLRHRIPRAFDLIAQPQADDDAVRLASLLDIDDDGAISDAELKASCRTLRFRDLDNDETFSVSELLPYRDPRSQNVGVAPDAVNLPFLHVTDRDSIQLAAARIMQRYGNEQQLSAVLLRQSDGIETTASASSEFLSMEDLRGVIEKPRFHLVMVVSLSVKANTSSIKVDVARGASAFCKPAAEQAFGVYRMVIDGLPLTVQALGGSANDRKSTQGYLGQTFVMSDGDQNQYLDETEFSGMKEAMIRAGVRTDFAAVDFDGDVMVTRDEVFSFAKRDQMVNASRVEVSVKQDGKTLFGLLDSNGDRRLSAREMRAGPEILHTYDFNQDNKFADSELGTAFILAISLGRPEFRRMSGQTANSSMPMGSADGILPRPESMQGPEWFRRMDRNQDGDVSPREFLGTGPQFKQIDVDSDKLISAPEAMSIDDTP